MRFSLFLLLLLVVMLVMECYGDPRYGRSRGRYRSRPRYRYRYRHRYNGCRYSKVNCQVSQWHAWSSCTEDCGSTGVRNRARHVIRPAKCNGNPCPSLTQQQPCNRKCYNGGTPRPGFCACRYGYSGKCCEKGGGSQGGFCSSKPDGLYRNPKDCGSFYHCAHGQTHLKYCTHGLHWNDKAKTCDWKEDAQCGKVDGGFSKWTAWSKCSATCGKGRQVRLRRCNNPPPSNGGADCVGSAMEARECILKQCQGGVDGGFSKWTAWSKCSATCGKGRQVRLRRCNNPPPSNGGADCVGSAMEARECILKECQGGVDGGFSKWTAWSKCSATCGKGRQVRLRRCNNPPPSNGGADCVGSAMEARECILKQCGGGCAWRGWSSWSQCTAQCGCGSKKRSRKCSCDDDNGYNKRGGYYGHHGHCQGKGEEEVDCNCHQCPGGNVNTESVGCFIDKGSPNRALPDFVAKFHGSTLAKDKIDACAHLAKTLKVEYFGMQDGGECWVDRSGVNDYSKHGKSTNCKDGIGGPWTNYVHKIVQ